MGYRGFRGNQVRGVKEVYRHKGLARFKTCRGLQNLKEEGGQGI